LIVRASNSGRSRHGKDRDLGVWRQRRDEKEGWCGCAPGFSLAGIGFQHEREVVRHAVYEVLPGRVVERAEAAREVIRSAGAISSPHILELSGVSDPDHLGRIGVPVVHELPGVGKNMQDHYVACVSYPVVGAQTANERSRSLPLAGEVMR